jgi:arylsulfatase A-like enzyme/Flp pilus assembly protein TadD
MRTRPLLFLLVVLVVGRGVVRAEVPNIIVITLDTTRADRMGFLGSKRGLTPNLDVVARQGIVFERAYSQAPLTPVSHATIFTGTYPQFHTVTDFGHALPEMLPYVPQILEKSGYHTAAFIGSIVLDPKGNMAPGFDRGFDFFDGGFHVKRGRDEDRYDALERRAGDVVGHAISWLSQSRRQPFFLWVHLYDPHAPYDPPPPYDKRRNLYDGEIAYADASLGKLFAYMRRRGLYDGALIAMMSDHGESLGDHGEEMHGIFLYDQTIHVPLIFKLPHELLAGRRVSSRVRLVDFAPTLLSMLSLPLPPDFQGQSLVPLMKRSPRAGPAPDLPAYSETDYPHRAFGWSALRSMRSGKYLFVRAPKRELYDQSQDKSEQHNLAKASPAVADTLQTQLDQFRDRTSSYHEHSSAAVSAQQSESLAALGYVSSGGVAASQNPLQGPDPKDKIQIANVLHQGMLAVEDARYEEAIPLLQKVVQDNPYITAAQLQLGIALARTRRFEEAIPALRKAIQQVPDSIPAQYELGLALYQSGQWKESAPFFENVAKKRPNFADAQYSLASVYARIQRVPEALDLLRRAIQLEPQHFQANLLLGRILTLQGNAQDGLPNLKKATAVEPESREAHLFLADAYTQLGMQEDADRERAEASHARLP